MTSNQRSFQLADHRSSRPASSNLARMSSTHEDRVLTVVPVIVTAFLRPMGRAFAIQVKEDVR
jgi:hypothetical protein